MSNKGISPLIAAVLLIAFTMTIAGLMAAWAQSFVSGQTEELTTAARESQQCTGANFNIDSIKTNSTHVSLVLYNNGGMELNDFDVFLTYENSTAGPVVQTVKNAYGSKLPVGDMASFSVALDQSIEPPLSKIKIAVVGCPNVYKERTFS